jgi:hypothetical protein
MLNICFQRTGGLYKLLNWMLETSKKKLLQSYDEYWRRLNQYFSLFARRSMSNHVHEQMRRVYSLLFPSTALSCHFYEQLS